MINNLLENLKVIIKRVFRKSKQPMLQEAIIQKDELLYEGMFEEETLINNETDLDKRDFFELYKKVKNGITSIDNLMINDLIKLQLMFQEEEMMVDKKIEEEEGECKKLDFELARLKNENQKLRMIV